MAKKNKKDVADDQLRLYWENFKPFAKDCLVVRDHNTASLLPFVFNAAQGILHTIAEKQKKERGYIRIFFLKSRRFGGSTYVQGRYYWRTGMNFNRNTFIIGHEEDSTTTLYRMGLLFQERNPIAPSTKKSNAKELIFDNKKGTGLKSEYRLATAKNVDAGRSQGIHYLHCSEEAFWASYAKELLNGLLQCIPDPPAESEVFRESTANGYGNTFQTGVFDAYCEGRYPYYTARLKDVCPHMDSDVEFVFAYTNPEKDWILVFIPWFCIERYQMDFESEDAKTEFAAKIQEPVFDPDGMKWVDSSEKKLQDRYGLSLEQLNWRAWAIENKCDGDIEKFEQEYPATIEEAFKTTGSNVYSRQLCDEIEVGCAKPALVGEVVDRGGQTKVKPNRHGKFSVWERPEKNESYFITVDSGGGIKPQAEKDQKEPDPTCIDVWNHRTGCQVAQWHGQIDYGLIANIVYLIGRLYRLAPACVELMNHGFTVVKDLQELKYPLYEHKPGRKGWLTTKATKPRMVDDLGEMARNGDIIIRCKETVSEMRTFVELNGSYNAATGCKDDRVDSAGMASQMITMLPKKFRSMSEKARQESDFTGFSNIHSRFKDSSQEDYKEVYVI